MTMELTIFFLITISKIVSIKSFHLIDEPIKVCSDGERVNFADSCRYQEAQCLEELDWLKERQDFGDFFFKRKGFRFHSLDDVVYTVRCEDESVLTHLPEEDNGQFVNIKVTFINSKGVNKTGYLTQFDIISLDQPTQKSIPNRVYEFTLPSGDRQIVKNGIKVTVKQLPFNSKIIEFFKYHSLFTAMYEKFLRNNLIYCIVRDYFAFFSGLIIVFIVLGKKAGITLFNFFIYFLKLFVIRGKSDFPLIKVEDDINWENIEKRVDKKLVLYLENSVSTISEVQKRATTSTKASSKATAKNQSKTEKNNLQSILRRLEKDELKFNEIRAYIMEFKKDDATLIASGTQVVLKNRLTDYLKRKINEEDHKTIE